MLKEMQQEIMRLKRERDVCILAHSYMSEDICEVADFTGDSYALSVRAKTAPQSVVVMCGVRFMAETVKMLSPHKKVLLANPDAGCPMAEQFDKEMIAQLKESMPGYAVVAYVNTTAELKTVCDVCVTSSSALKICRAIPQKDIIFIPDINLGTYVAKNIPEKNFKLLHGGCPTHARMTKADALKAKAAHPGAEVLTHPECTEGVRALSDFIGSTADIIRRAGESGAESFIVCTEPGVLYELRTRYPSKRFIPVSMACADMKKNTLEALYACLAEGKGEVRMGEEEMNAARRPLERMLELAK